jgi:hypothetical protein
MRAWKNDRLDIIQGMLMMFLSQALMAKGLDHDGYIKGFGHA